MSSFFCFFYRFIGDMEMLTLGHPKQACLMEFFFCQMPILLGY
jgi:hypothetical protein